MGSRRRALLNNVGNAVFGRAQRSFETPDVRKAERKGERLGLLLYRLDRKHRERTHANLELAFPDWAPERRETIARDVFKHFGIVTADFMRSPIRTHQEVLDNMEVEGFEHFEAAEALGKGVIAVTAHLGNWERFGHWCTAIGRHISVVARDANDSEIQDRIAKIRENTGIAVLSRGKSAREMLAKLRRKEIIGLLPDQNSGESFVPFFGHPCGTVLGPAVLHQRTGAALLPSYCVRTGPGKYRVVLRPLVDPDVQEKDAEVITAQLNLVLESVIRDYPEQYLWMHDRWKSARMRGLL
jgi:KDO2-lipid IV(A) lauroyltransferase